MNININELEQLLYYLQDKTQECYKFEAKQAINRFLENLRGGFNI